QNTILGLGIPKGVTLIVGGGYHGKSTLLNALEMGVYDHRAKDGREYVLTQSDAVKIRSEDGRAVHHEDISDFIQNLPSKKSTVDFVSEDA
ncbi:MAG: ABC-ATPase domain-containing protein, partial [Allobaculum sp.]|nr:ABC-ATPase domain-containing protein [Allobaculum sp.]